MEQLSEFEREAIAALAVSDPQRDAILSQLSCATCASRDYTGVGRYTEIAVAADAPKLDEARSRAADAPSVFAEHPEVPAGVGLILWLENGYISCLESYTYEGSWPQDESLFRLAT
jgi:hypothetical protein